MRAEASKYADWDVNVITAISEAESTQHGVACNVNARGDGHLTFKVKGRTYGYSISVMQVRILPGREHCDKHDLKTNIKCAHAIWKGQGYSAWSVYNSGKYLSYLGR